jgi:hypothetical protein
MSLIIFCSYWNINGKQFIFVTKPKKLKTMKKVFKPLACVFSAIATVLMLIGIILWIAHSRLFDIRPFVWYFSAINFILFAILFHFAGTDSDTEKKP